MDTAKLKKFAQFARRTLIGQVGAKLDLVLDPASAARRECPKAVGELEKAVRADGREGVIERVAYIWFNRFCALRYMDVNAITAIRVVSPLPGAFQPEILAEAKAGNIDDSVPENTRQTIRDLLDGRAPSSDPQAESYRLLLVAICNDWHKPMPFMFEKIEDYTELLMPGDLLSNNSILAYTREAMTPDACEDVEIIGWLYQFYISEKKDEVFAGLKKNVKITPENIPAATQLFTPHWIVRYLVENSLGRLWMLNHPQSKLTDKMDYYIAPVEPETDFLRVASPEEIKICDPACGSGHMLTYAFDLLYAIYEEEGYDPADIPSLILRHNLFGIEIDERAGALAAFALVMKARGRQKRFFRKGISPNICVLQNVSFEDQELAEYTKKVGCGLFADEPRETLKQFSDAKNFGSLIVPKLKDVSEVARVVDAQDFEGNLFLRATHQRVQRILCMAEYLSPKYHVVVANPPYMNGGGMNSSLKNWLAEHYKDSRSDLMTCFMDRNQLLLRHNGYWGMINLPSWMFLSTFEKFRSGFLRSQTLTSLLHLGRGIFGSDFGSVAFCVQSKEPTKGVKGIYRKLFEKHVQVRQADVIETLFHRDDYGRFSFDQERLLSIPGAPIAYWFQDAAFDAFEAGCRLEDVAKARRGLSTGNNERFIRFWHEVSGHDSSQFDSASEPRWYPYHKGGAFRRWYGNNDLVVDWGGDGCNIKGQPAKPSGDRGWRTTSEEFYLQEGITWTGLTAGEISFRKSPEGFLFDTNKGPMAFPARADINKVLGFLNSRPTAYFLAALNPTLSTQNEDIDNLPFVEDWIEEATLASNMLSAISQSDWDAFETSWDFATLPLLQPEHHRPALAEAYANLRQHWQGMTDKMQRLEEENNRIFIDAYGLQDELTPEVPLKEITLTCNPAYRYGGKNTDEELEDKLRADTMHEFLSYAVGCMFGRYSLDAPSLILANQGETLADYLARVPTSDSGPTFTPDEDNVIPILDGDWFPDDITERFRKFLRVTFGEDHFQDNIEFIERALGKTIRKYFLKDFYTDHWKRYKKRPIYWMFASPKGTFQALIYLHRYRPDTVSVVLNDYLRVLIRKLEEDRRAEEKLSISQEASPKQRTDALKNIEKFGKQITELMEWERDILFPLATRKIAIDLDDGVKANYPKFGKALKKIVGLSK